MYRRQSSRACVADIVRGVQHEHTRSLPRALYDLIPTEGGAGVPRVCMVELSALPPHETDAHTCFYRDNSDTPKDNCKICIKSNPDVSARPHKSCLKQRPPQLSCSSSLPSIHPESSAEHNDTNIQLDNTHANDTTTHSTYTNTDKVLHKISHDLDFLLNRTSTRAVDHCSQHIEEAPT
ncbi:hypothetical protein PYW08_007755 [Mythimna loreyi]|uniref:Uncharacterized protein n=1 Tax=Mythimna loreyi TaxID=667449 RepID=A0ACC2QDR3_9NEOP|nr:hypothetical protein PYW08_007755 [Mythimna loreyi]